MDRLGASSFSASTLARNARMSDSVVNVTTEYEVEGRGTLPGGDVSW